jgi:N-acetylglucosaminyl-diphospho-decaprenol L-rhamnosyltransferase
MIAEALCRTAATPSTELITTLVVIVNYRCADLTIDCLASLEAEIASLPGISVTVVDNASGDGSADRITRAIHERGWSKWASFQPRETNGGFAAGNNTAILPALASATSPRYVLLLNPDTVIRPGAVHALVEFMERNPGVGLSGSRLEDPDGTTQRSAFRFPSILGEIEAGMRFGPVTRLLSRYVVARPVQEAAGPTDWVAGASLMIRREVIEAIGALDDDYFMYFEEVDFCLRARRAGWPCWYVPESRVVHLVGQSSGVTDTAKATRRRPAYWFQARRRYYLKHHGRLKTFFADLAWTLSYMTYLVRCAFQRKPDRDPEKLLRDFIRHNFLLPIAGR